QGIVHRDLKPANIVRLHDGTVKICDFGIARLGHDIGYTSRLTGTGIAMGTPHYMSPEQIGGSEVDRRSDLYSFGCVLYEIATGVPPFDLDDAWAILVGHRDTPPPPPREHRAELPEHLERLILDLLAKEPGGRPDSARELTHRLAALGTGGDRPPAPAARPPRPARGHRPRRPAALLDPRHDLRAQGGRGGTGRVGRGPGGRGTVGGVDRPTRRATRRGTPGGHPARPAGAGADHPGRP